MSTDSSLLGKLGEDLAEKFLKTQGYKIIERNWKPKKWGEIDIVAVDGDTLVFVEVKARSVDPMMKPYEAVNRHKIRILKRVGKIYSRSHDSLPKALRIDVISIEFKGREDDYDLEFFKNVDL